MGDTLVEGGTLAEGGTLVEGAVRSRELKAKVEPVLWHRNGNRYLGILKGILGPRAEPLECQKTCRLEPSRLAASKLAFFEKILEEFPV